jgi:hypothetical protein
MSKASIIIVFISFIILLFFTFFGGRIIFSSMRMPPEEILGRPVPKNFQVEQSIKTDEAMILVGVDRENELRLHIVKSANDSIKSTGELYVAGKEHLTVADKKSNHIFVRYLAANLDLRRSKVIDDAENEEDFILLEGPKSSYQAIFLDYANNTLFIGMHPKEMITQERFAKSISGK